MEHKRRAFYLATIIALAMSILAGCGDAGMFSRGELRAMNASKLGAEIDPNRVSVKRVSPRCDADAATACPEAAAPALEVHLDERSIVIDFSNVDEPGVFDEDFDGVEISFDDLVEGGSLLFAAVDTEATSVDLDEERVAFGDEYLDIDLSGVAYDQETFIKIDLLLGPLNLLRYGDS